MQHRSAGRQRLPADPDGVGPGLGDDRLGERRQVGASRRARGPRPGAAALEQQVDLHVVPGQRGQARHRQRTGRHRQVGHDRPRRVDADRAVGRLPAGSARHAVADDAVDLGRGPPDVERVPGRPLHGQAGRHAAGGRQDGRRVARRVVRAHGEGEVAVPVARGHLVLVRRRAAGDGGRRPVVGGDLVAGDLPVVRRRGPGQADGVVAGGLGGERGPGRPGRRGRVGVTGVAHRHHHGAVDRQRDGAAVVRRDGAEGLVAQRRAGVGVVVLETAGHPHGRAAGDGRAPDAAVAAVPLAQVVRDVVGGDGRAVARQPHPVGGGPGHLQVDGSRAPCQVDDPHGVGRVARVVRLALRAVVGQPGAVGRQRRRTGLVVVAGVREDPRRGRVGDRRDDDPGVPGRVAPLVVRALDLVQPGERAAVGADRELAGRGGLERSARHDPAGGDVDHLDAQRRLLAPAVAEQDGGAAPVPRHVDAQRLRAARLGAARQAPQSGRVGDERLARDARLGLVERAVVVARPHDRAAVGRQTGGVGGEARCRHLRRPGDVVDEARAAGLPVADDERLAAVVRGGLGRVVEPGVVQHEAPVGRQVVDGADRVLTGDPAAHRVEREGGRRSGSGRGSCAGRGGGEGRCGRHEHGQCEQAGQQGARERHEGLRGRGADHASTRAPGRCSPSKVGHRRPPDHGQDPHTARTVGVTDREGAPLRPVRPARAAPR